MNCREFAGALVGDDPAAIAAAEGHAAECETCARLLAQDRRIARAVAEWKRQTPGPPLSLERKIAAALRRETAENVRVAAPTAAARGAAGRRWIAAAAAAVVLTAASLALVFSRFREEPWQAELAQAVQQVEQSERSYSSAIDRLEKKTAEVLARADDPSLPDDQAAVLLAYRDRIAHLDSVIAEVRAFLDQNPGHSGGHSVLLAAYKEKSDVLQQVLDLQPGVS